MTTAVQTSSEGSATNGCVKWFNNKAGYGFISITDSETGEDRDMFVHHSEIKVDQTQYKYLVQGEYVEFVTAPITRENKTDIHATNVRGINGGKLMCETRNEVRSYRASSQQTTEPRQQASNQAHRQQASKQTARPQTDRPQTARPQTDRPQTARPPQSLDSRRPQLEKADQSEWMVVPRRRADTVSSKQPRQRQPQIEIA